MNLGFSELFMIFLVALVLFGPDKLPELARLVGRAVREFRKASADLHYTMRDTFDHLQEGRSPEAPLLDLAQKYDPRALIQEVAGRPPADEPASSPALPEAAGSDAEGASTRGPAGPGEAASTRGPAGPGEAASTRGPAGPGEAAAPRPPQGDAGTGAAPVDATDPRPAGGRGTE